MKRLLILLAFVTLLSSISSGQVLRGRIDGTVRDPQEQVVPNAKITVKNLGTGSNVTVNSTDDGTFTVPELQPGNYVITAELQGFKTSYVEGIVVQVASVTSVVIRLELGTVSEQVTVSADDVEATINTSNAEVGEVVDRQRILELPLDGRNPFELTALQAGVQTKPSADGDASKFSINGNRTVANNLTVDGINANDNFLKTPANVTLSVIPVSVESIGEFRVITSLPSAEFGRGTAQINAVTASGTNQFRGSVFEYHRNTVFNANNTFNNTSGLDREPLIRNQFGGRLGGPIIKDRTHFFGSYEGKRESRGFSRNRLVYTQEALTGIFRYLKNVPTTPANVAAAPGSAPAGTASTQSGTCRATAGGTPPRVVIPNGWICVQNVLALGNRNGQPIDPTIRDILAIAPLPNNFEIGDGLNTGGFRFNSMVSLPTDQFSGRLDHRFNNKHSFEATFNYGNILFDGDYINSGEPVFPNSNNRTRKTVGRGTQGTLRSALTSTLINEFRVGAQFSSLNFGNTADFARGYQFDFGDITDPEIDFEGSGRDLRVFQITDNVTWIRGNHTFKTGIEVRKPWVRRFTRDGTIPTLEFGTGNTTGFSQANHFAGSSAEEYVDARELANALTGAISSITQVFNVVDADTLEVIPFAPEVRTYSNWETNLYFQDSWKVSPRLALNLGLRYELNTSPRELNNLGLVPTNGSAGLYGVSGDGNLFMPGTLTGSSPILDRPANGKLFNTDYDNFAPVVGFAWSPFKNINASIRGGYRISYFQGSFNTIDGTLDDNEGLILTVERTQSSGYLRDGFAPIATPTTTLPAPQSIQTASTVDIRAFDEDIKTPYIHDFNFGVQWEILKNTALEVRYVGNRGRKLYRGYDVNEVNIFAVDPNTGQSFLDAFRIAQNNLALSRAAGLGDNFGYNSNVVGSQVNPLFDVFFGPVPSEFSNPNYITRIDQNAAGELADYFSRVRGTIAGHPGRGWPFFEAVARGQVPLNFLRANPDVRGAQLFTNGSTSAYDSLQIELTRRLRSGLRFQASYVFAKGLSDFTGSTGDTNSFLTLRDTRREYSQYTNTHQFLANALYQLPFGRGRKYLNGNGWASHLVSGWQMGTIFKYTSGDPLSITSGRGTYNRNDRSASNTVDIAGGLNREQIQALAGIRSTSSGVFYFDPDLAPGSTSDPSNVVFLNPQAGTIGALGLSSVIGPRYMNVDFSTLKRTRITETMNVEFRAEIFNLFNTVNYDNPDLEVNSPSFGRIINIVGRPRFMQFAIRLNF
jgi:hypothetical protein